MSLLQDSKPFISGFKKQQDRNHIHPSMHSLYEAIYSIPSVTAIGFFHAFKISDRDIIFPPSASFQCDFTTAQMIGQAVELTQEPLKTRYLWEVGGRFRLNDCIWHIKTNDSRFSSSDLYRHELPVEKTVSDDLITLAECITDHFRN